MYPRPEYVVGWQSGVCREISLCVMTVSSAMKDLTKCLGAYGNDPYIRIARLRVILRLSELEWNEFGNASGIPKEEHFWDRRCDCGALWDRWRYEGQVHEMWAKSMEVGQASQ